MSWFQMIPLQFYYRHLGGHQMSRRKLSKILKISLQKTCKRQKVSLLKVCKRLKILVNDRWITYHQNQKWLTKCSSLLKTKLKKFMKREIVCSNQHRPNLLWRIFAIQYRIKGSNGYDPGSFLLNSKQPITNLMINSRQTKVKLIFFVYDGEGWSKKWWSDCQRGCISF